MGTKLSAITAGKIRKPYLLVTYGVPGVGKSTLCADAPSAIFLGAEDGTSSLDVRRFPSPQTLQDALDCMNELLNDEHPYQTLVIDSLDWLEPLVWKHVCSKHEWDSIEAPGWGKGYVAALDTWKEVIQLLTQLREKRGMNILLIAHSQVKTVEDPREMKSYMRYSLKLNEKASALIQEFVDCILFATYKMHVVTNEAGKTKGLSDGSRVLYTEWRPGFIAKNRLELPFELPFPKEGAWQIFEAAVAKGFPEDPAIVRASIEELLKHVPDEALKAAIQKSMEGADATKLAKIRNRVETILAEKAG